MNSGIYMLKFRSGDLYIGQAKDFHKRWQQHSRSLEAGKHTKLLQDAYRRSGGELPEAKIVIECHPHHLDLYEAHVINEIQPNLNHQIPPDLTEEEAKWMVALADSGSAHNSIPKLVEAVWEGNQARAELESLKNKWDDKVALELAALDGYDELVGDLGILKARLDGTRRELVQLQHWRDKVQNLNWWQRLWRMW